jgi:hypothetical protein
MPHNTTQHIVHTIGGGWATDYGPTFYGAPQGGQLKLPWLTQAENLVYTLDGGVEKWPGVTLVTLTPLKDPILGSTTVKGIFDYWRQASNQKLVASVGNSYFDITSGTLIGSTSSSVVTDKPHFSTFNDLLILAAEGNQAPRSWDQTTFQNLAGTPPTFSFSTPHAGRHWGSGYPSNPSRLYYSAVGNPEDWIGAGSGSIDIDPGDGDKIVGIISWKRELFVFKGPNRLSIHRITGTSPSDFARTNFVTGISAASQHSIFEYAGDIGFWSPRGSCHSLTTTASYGDYTQSFINYPILSWCRNQLNMGTSDASYWQAVTNANAGYTILNYTGPGAAFATNDSALLMDWRFVNQGEPYPRFSRLTYSQYSSVAMVQASGQIQPYWGTKNGIVHRTLSDLPPHRSAASYAELQYGGTYKTIPLRLQSPYLTYGTDLETKTISNFSLTLSTAHRSTVDVKWGGSKQLKQSTTITQPGYTPLGSFVLGTDCLGELGDQPVFAQELSGDYRSIQYTIIEDTASAGMLLKNFGASLTPTGESLET